MYACDYVQIYKFPELVRETTHLGPVVFNHMETSLPTDSKNSFADRSVAPSSTQI